MPTDERAQRIEIVKAMHEAGLVTDEEARMFFELAHANDAVRRYLAEQGVIDGDCDQERN